LSQGIARRYPESRNQREPAENGAIQMLQHIFEESCFLDLEDDQGQMIGHTPGEIIAHLIGSNVNLEDYDDEITAIAEGMRTEYDPSEMPQVYYKKLQTGQIMLIQLTIPCDDDNTMIQTAMNQSSKNIWISMMQ
jgi:hypothetical protein